ncbi:MAG: cell division protein FtsI [Lachnospiraceae bacterium]|nr:cell division protein FtsI [Lachnospiraceae bacterium]
MGKKRQNRTGSPKFNDRMKKKLTVSSLVILLAFLGLSVRLYAINRDNGEVYKRQVLSQQSYDSIVLPAKRGEIVDRNGTKMAVSEKVYNICIDSKTLNSENGKYLDHAIQVLFAQGAIEYSYTQSDLRAYILDNPGSRYRVIAKKQSYDAVSDLMGAISGPEKDPELKGIWLEETYKRTYPYNSLAADVIGFVQGENEGAYGLEEFYNSTLVGTNGREYGYLNDDENLERTTKPAENGMTLITSLDVNVQSIVEKHIQAFNKEHENEFREGDGAKNIGVIIMNPDNGEVIAMASSPGFDLNDPRNTDGLELELPEEFQMAGIIKVEQGKEGASLNASDSAEIDIAVPAEKSVDINNQGSENKALTAESDSSNNGTDQGTTDQSTDPNGESYTAPVGAGQTEETGEAEDKPMTYEEAYEAAKMEALNARWKNFCINSTYEPGSTMKPFTMATGLESGKLTGNENYVCGGVKEVGGHKIHCSNRLGHGPLTFSQALENSCNVAFMDMGNAIGKDTFMKYNRLFNFGLKTNIDLTGEALTNSLVFDLNTMTPTDLAISSFGQGFNVTMIQMITGFCSLVNGGYYYQPHIVTKIVNDAGATVQSIEPRVLKQTVSKETSDKIVELCTNVVELGTGKSARPAGYKIGGKTGTAEKYPRKRGNYLVSFMGFAPSDDPQLVIYTCIDEPNVPSQASARYATVLTRDILTEVLPYMHIFKTEEMTEEEIAELKEKELDFAITSGVATPAEEAGLETVNGEGESAEGQVNGEEKPEGEKSEGAGEAASEDGVITFVDKEKKEKPGEYKKPEIKIDEATGYAIDPSTGALLDPETGVPVDGNISDLE